MAKCVWCGRRKRLFEKFNKYGFCPECKAQVRQDIEGKISEVKTFLNSYKNGIIHNDDERLKKSVDAYVAALDDLEEMRERVPMFKSSTNHLRAGLTDIRHSIESRDQTSSEPTAKNSTTKSDDEQLDKSVRTHAVILDDLDETHERVPMFKCSTDHLKADLVDIQHSIESCDQTIDQSTATTCIDINNVECPVEILDEMSTASGTIDKEPVSFNVNKMFPRVKQVGNLRVDNHRDCKAFDNLLSSIERVPITFLWDVENYVDVITMQEVKFTNVVKRSKREILCNYTVVDVETTGLNHKRNAITEISAIKFRAFSPIAVFSTLVNPQQNISEEIVRLTGITNDMVDEQPFFYQVVPCLLEFLGKDTLVGHNLIFDLKFLTSNGVDVFSVKRRFYDTLSLAKKALPQYKLVYNENGTYYRDYSAARVENYKLQTLCDYYKIYRSSAHRSESDCLATGLLFKQLVDEILD